MERVPIHERRESFRVTDKVMLRSLAISKEQALNGNIPSAFADDPGYVVLREIQTIDQDSHHLLQNISLQSRELEQYLRGLNKKIELLATLLIKQHPEQQPKATVEVSLSEAGIAFPSETPHAAGSYLALQLTLLPSHISLLPFAQVVSCNPDQDGSFAIACNFIGLSAADQQIIAKHVFQLQLMQKRQQRTEGL